MESILFGLKYLLTSALTTSIDIDKNKLEKDNTINTRSTYSTLNSTDPNSDVYPL